MSHFKVTDYGELLLLSAAHMIFRKKQQSKLQIDFSLKAFLTFQHFVILIKLIIRNRVWNIQQQWDFFGSFHTVWIWLFKKDNNWDTF